MGKAGKKRRSAERMKRKRAEKERKKALYASYAGTGRRAAKRKSTVKAGAFDHATSNCGNVGCKKCYPPQKVA